MLTMSASCRMEPDWGNVMRRAGLTLTGGIYRCDETRLGSW